MRVRTLTTTQNASNGRQGTGRAECRRQYLTDNRTECEALLKMMWADLKADSPEDWKLLRFKDIHEAVKWACEQWGSEDFRPEHLGWSEALLPCVSSTFAVTDFWELLRLADQQKKGIQEDSRPSRLRMHELGHKRQESILGSKYFPETPRTEGNDPPEYDSYSSAQTELEVSLEQFVDRIQETLEALATKVHSALPVLWLEHQEDLRRVLAGYFGTVLFRRASKPSWPECITQARSSARSKASSLALCRFAVLYFPMSLEKKHMEDAAFYEIYLQNVENPPWPIKVRDRWDVVPKAVAATRLQKLKFKVSPNQVRDAARDRLGALTRKYMDSIRYRTDPEDYPQNAVGSIILMLELILARDSITRTLQDEYARSDRPGAITGPGSKVIEHWHTEINETLAELRLHHRTLSEDPS